MPNRKQYYYCIILVFKKTSFSALHHWHIVLHVCIQKSKYFWDYMNAGFCFVKCRWPRPVGGNTITMLLRARFFDDWRLSRIDEEVERLSVNSDTSVAVDTTSPSLRTIQRSSSAEGFLQSDDDEPPLPPPPSPLPLMTPHLKDSELDDEHLRRLDEEAEALRFLQVKYDTLGKVKMEKPQMTSASQLSSSTSTTSGVGETAAAVGPQCRLNCDCSLTSAVDERPRMAVDFGSVPPSSTSTRSSVTDRRRPPPPPTKNRDECSCPTPNSTGSCVERLQLGSVDDHRYNHHHHYQGQQQLEQFAYRQRCSQKPASTLCHQQETRDVGSPAVCSCPINRAARDVSSRAERQSSSMLSNAELFQIDLFYRSRKTFVYVGSCPAALYFARAATGSGGGASSWRFAAAGVPVIVVDTVRVAVGGPRLHVVLAERGTGFELWRYGLADTKQYAVGDASTTGFEGGGSAAFHTLSLPSGDVAGLRFDDDASADEFHHQTMKLAELYSTSGTGSRNRKGKKTKKITSGIHATVTPVAPIYGVYTPALQYQKKTSTLR